MAESLERSGRAAALVTQDRVLAAVILALAVSVFIVSGSYQAGAQVFPRAISVILTLSAILLFFRKSPVWSEEEDGAARPADEPGGAVAAGTAAPVAVALALAILYVAGVRWMGFITASLIYVPVNAYLLGLRNWAWITIGTVVFVAGSAVLFLEIFKAPLPPERILTWF